MKTYFDVCFVGVVVYSSIFKDKVQLNVGVGVNLSNCEPTVCVNSVAKSLGISPIRREDYLAWTFNCLEQV